VLNAGKRGHQRHHILLRYHPLIKKNICFSRTERPQVCHRATHNGKLIRGSSDTGKHYFFVNLFRCVCYVNKIFSFASKRTNCNKSFHRWSSKRVTSLCNQHNGTGVLYLL